MKATLPRRIDLLTSPLKIELPQLVICTELDEPTGGYHIEVIWRGKLPSTIHSESNNAKEDGKLQTSKQDPKDMDDENEKTTLLVATAFVASFGLSLKSGRLLCTSEEFSGRVAIQSTLIGNLLFHSGNVGKKTVHKYEKLSASIGKSSSHLAWVMDDDTTERDIQ